MEEERLLEEDQEFSLEDIMKEFGSQSDEPIPEELLEEMESEEAEKEVEEENAPSVTADTIRIDVVEQAEEQTASVTADTIRMDVTALEQVPAASVTTDTIRLDVDEVASVAADTACLDVEKNSPSVTSDTIRLDVEQLSEQPEEEAAAPAEQPQESADPFAEGWEPEYEQPIAEYVPPRPILMHPRSRLKELKSKLVAGPEKLYYKLMEKGVGKLQAAIFFSILVVVISAIATCMDAFGMVSPNRMKLLAFGQFMAMLIAALLGSNQLLEGFGDLLRKRFTLNTLLIVSFLLCCIDGVICLYELPKATEPRIPCCAAFALQMIMALWSTYQNRTTLMGQMDTMRKATHLNSIVLEPAYYEGNGGLLRSEGEVEDFMDHYRDRSKLDKVLSVYALVAVIVSLLLGITAGVLHGVSMGLQVAAVTILAAVPASIFVTISRPMAILERRLHKLGAVLCGWRGIVGLSQKAVFPLTHEDLCPTGSVKLNGVKFYTDRDSDETIAYCAALCNADGGALAPVFNALLESRNGIRYEVANFNAYGDGGIGGEINAEPVLVGTLPFLQKMGVDVPEGMKVKHAVGISVDGELCGLFAIAYEKVRASNAGLGTLTGYRKLRPILVTDDFMMTDEFIRSKFGANPKRVICPDQQTRMELQSKKPSEESPVLALSTGNGFAPFAYCATGARALKRAATLGVIVHLIGGILGMGIMGVLAVLGAGQLLTPTHLFLYQIVWMVPGLLITEWTRTI